MIYSTRLSTTGDTLVFTSSTTGAPITGGVVGQTSAVTSIIVCNTGTPNLTDESVNSADLTINLVPSGSVSSATNTIVTHLTIPAGETVFFSDERIVLNSGDQIRATSTASNLLSITVSALAV